MVKQTAREVGFDLCGVVSPEIPTDDVERYQRWVDAGRHAGMAYMDRYVEVRADPRLLMKGTRSVVCLGLLYNVDAPKSTEADADGRAWISRYAWGGDYHDVARGMLRELSAGLKAACSPFDFKARGCVDTAPLFERSLAARAGLGWIGKNGNLINERLGSYFFLCELLVNVDLAFDEPAKERCGDCAACLDACPGGAIVAPREVDARRCASYLTIEHRGEFDADQSSAITRNVFGCDICQDVCPWNSKAATTGDKSFEPREGTLNPRLDDLDAIDAAGFEKQFAGSPVERCRYEGYIRNLATVRANLGAGGKRSS